MCESKVFHHQRFLLSVVDIGENGAAVIKKITETCECTIPAKRFPINVNVPPILSFIGCSRNR